MKIIYKQLHHTSCVLCFKWPLSWYLTQTVGTSCRSRSPNHPGLPMTRWLMHATHAANSVVSPLWRTSTKGSCRVIASTAEWNWARLACRRDSHVARSALMRKNRLVRLGKTRSPSRVVCSRNHMVEKRCRARCVDGTNSSFLLCNKTWNSLCVQSISSVSWKYHQLIIRMNTILQLK